ncbi:hypothetical protein GCM10022404_19410 [Celeribacter arenosi]|uniref:Uncharacterized protein n=1 Tax=Celeribacter arenosi TaxID=792649 RepID=A0ABP7K8Q1_9RHOB
MWKKSASPDTKETMKKDVIIGVAYLFKVENTVLPSIRMRRSNVMRSTAMFPSRALKEYSAPKECASGLAPYLTSSTRVDWQALR